MILTKEHQEHLINSYLKTHTVTETIAYMQGINDMVQLINKQNNKDIIVQDRNKLVSQFMGSSYSVNYDISWNNLIPIIKKINEVTNYDDYDKNRIHLQRTLDDCINENAVDIKSVYEAILEFIEQYNRNN